MKCGITCLVQLGKSEDVVEELKGKLDQATEQLKTNENGW